MTMGGLLRPMASPRQAQQLSPSDGNFNRVRIAPASQVSLTGAHRRDVARTVRASIDRKVIVMRKLVLHKALGFSETSSFTAAFRKATGLTPTAYHRSLV
jgi:AraC-like DNA-binding protein